MLGSLSTENMEGKLEFLRSVGVLEDQLGLVGSSALVLRVLGFGSGFRVVYFVATQYAINK